MFDTKWHDLYVIDSRAFECKVQVKCISVHRPLHFGNFESKSRHVLEDWVKAKLRMLACQMPDNGAISWWWQSLAD